MAAIDEVLEFLNGAKTWYLATVDEEGNPQVRPFGAQNIYEGKLYIQTGLKKDVAKQLQANGKVAICAMNKGKWLRISATAVYDPSAEAQESMLEANPGLKRMYAVNDGNTAVFYLKDAKATVFSFTEDPVSLDF